MGQKYVYSYETHETQSLFLYYLLIFVLFSIQTVNLLLPHSARIYVCAPIQCIYVYKYTMHTHTHAQKLLTQNQVGGEG